MRVIRDDIRRERGAGMIGEIHEDGGSGGGAQASREATAQRCKAVKNSRHDTGRDTTGESFVINPLLFIYRSQL